VDTIHGDHYVTQILTNHGRMGGREEVRMGRWGRGGRENGRTGGGQEGTDRDVQLIQTLIFNIFMLHLSEEKAKCIFVSFSFPVE